MPVTSALVALLVMDQCHRFPPTTGSTFESLFQETRLTGRVSLVGFFFLFIDLCFKPYTLKILLVSVLFVSNRACRCVVSGLLRANLCVAGSLAAFWDPGSGMMSRPTYSCRV